jgi:hypothetical protein
MDHNPTGKLLWVIIEEIKKNKHKKSYEVNSRENPT